MLIRKRNIIDISVLILTILIALVGDFVESIPLIELSKAFASFFLLAIYVYCYRIYFEYSKNHIDSISFK